MRYTLSLIICLMVLVSCQSHHDKPNELSGNQNSIDVWFDNTFINAETDTSFVFPDYYFNTDWMQRYAQYIKNHFMNNGDLWFTNSVDDYFDCRYWTLAYVDNDTIPEMLLYGGCWASGGIILTQYENEVYSSPRGAFSYIKNAGGLLHSQRRHDDDIWGVVYEMANGKFVEKVSYYCRTEYVDTNDVVNFGLKLDNLRNHYAGGVIGDSVVGVSEIGLNGKRISTCFGYNVYVYCEGLEELKRKMDYLYFDKGTNTYFPFPSHKKLVSELISGQVFD